VLKKRLVNKIKRKEAKIAVIGIGYVGLPTAAILANLGFQVTGVDINPKIVNEVSQGRSHTHLPGLDKLISKTHRQGNLKGTENTLQAVSEADITIVCVQTPLNKDRKPDLTHLKKVCKSIAKVLTKGKLIVIQSTVPPKTTKDFVVPFLEEQSGLKCGMDFWLAYCPERMTPGSGLKDLATNARIIGGYDSESAELGTELFKTVTRGELWLTNLATAEVAKLAENTFRYVNVAFANELALVCKEIGVDVAEVIKLANTHQRVNIHKPGCGVGGPCLRKDMSLLLNSTETENFRPEIMSASRRLNDYMPKHTAKLAVDALRKVGKSVENCKIAIFGTAYKGEVNDARNSPAEEIIRKLISLRARVVVYDPYCAESFGAKKTKDIMGAVRGADCIIVTNDHKAFRELELPRIKALMNETPIIVDGRRMINPKEAKMEGFIYIAIGYDTGLGVHTGKNTHAIS